MTDEDIKRLRELTKPRGYDPVPPDPQKALLAQCLLELATRVEEIENQMQQARDQSGHGTLTSRIYEGPLTQEQRIALDDAIDEAQGTA